LAQVEAWAQRVDTMGIAEVPGPSTTSMASDKSSTRVEVEVETSQGTIVGFKSGSIAVFRGVPYARCQRFRLAERVEPFGRLNCTKSGLISPQPVLASPSGLLTLAVKGRGCIPSRLPDRMDEERCLNLQMYVPQGRGPVPVFVYIHGGAFIYGSNRHYILQHKRGCKLAESQGVAVILINYRLGPLGFLKVPGGEANLGVRDVVAALRWIHAEGPSFGLDPGAVTLAGESAGAMITGALLRAPSVRGLFQRAVMMSGSPQNILPREDAELLGSRFASEIDPWASPLHKLLQVGVRIMDGHGPLPFQPCWDGDFLVEGFFAEGIDMLMGTTEDEMQFFRSSLPLYPGGAASSSVADRLSDILGPEGMDCDATAEQIAEVVSEVQRSYSVKKDTETLIRLLSCLVFEAPLLTTAEELKDSNNIYLYRNDLGKGHGGELGFVFGTWDTNIVFRLMSGIAPLGGAKAAADGLAMEQLWGEVLGSFVRTGRPSDTWPRYGKEGLAVALRPAAPEVIPAFTRACKQICDLTSHARKPWGLKLRRVASDVVLALEPAREQIYHLMSRPNSVVLAFTPAREQFCHLMSQPTSGTNTPSGSRFQECPLRSRL